MKLKIIGIILIGIFCISQSCTKIDTTPREQPEEETTEETFCWLCTTNIYQWNYECGGRVSNAGTLYNVSRVTLCDRTEEEIHAYEDEHTSMTSEVTNSEKCKNGQYKTMYTRETSVTCKKKD